MARLHTDPLTLPRSALEPRFAEAIELARAAQSTPFKPSSERDALALDDGTLFVPDMADAKAGVFAIITGGIAVVFGAAFAGIVLDGKQAGSWMPAAALVLIAVGAVLLVQGRQRNRTARSAPRTTGAYLFDDALVHVGVMGNRVYPVERIRGFSYKTRSGSSGFTLRVRFVHDDGREQEDSLLDRDTRPQLEAWLAGKR